MNRLSLLYKLYFISVFFILYSCKEKKVKFIENELYNVYVDDEIDSASLFKKRYNNKGTLVTSYMDKTYIGNCNNKILDGKFIEFDSKMNVLSVSWYINGKQFYYSKLDNVNRWIDIQLIDTSRLSYPNVAYMDYGNNEYLVTINDENYPVDYIAIGYKSDSKLHDLHRDAIKNTISFIISSKQDNKINYEYTWEKDDVFKSYEIFIPKYE